jgi:hypothetical protein
MTTGLMMIQTGVGIVNGLQEEQFLTLRRCRHQSAPVVINL